MFRRKFWVLGSAAAVLLFLGAFLFASPPAAEATLVVSEGEVTVEHAVNRLLVVPAREQVSLSSGGTMALTAGDTLKLAKGATAQLRFMDGSTVDLTDEALLHITELIDSQDSFRVRLYLFAGRTASRVVHLIDADDAFVISTPSSTTSVRGTRFTVNVIDEVSSEVVCDEGRVLVSTEEQSVEVPAGFQLRVETGKPLEVQPRLDPENPATAGFTTSPETAQNTTGCPPGGCFVPSVTPEPTNTAQPVVNSQPQQDSQPASQPDTRPTTKPTATATATTTPTATATKTATPTATASPTPAATSTRSATVVPTNTAAPTSAPTATPASSGVDSVPTTPPPDEPTPTATPPTAPTATPTAQPTSMITGGGESGSGIDSLPTDTGCADASCVTPTTPAPAATTPAPVPVDNSVQNPADGDNNDQGENTQ